MDLEEGRVLAESIKNEVQRVAKTDILAKLLTWGESVSESEMRVKATKEIINQHFWAGLERIKQVIDDKITDYSDSGGTLSTESELENV